MKTQNQEIAERKIFLEKYVGWNLERKIVKKEKEADPFGYRITRSGLEVKDDIMGKVMAGIIKLRR